MTKILAAALGLSLAALTQSASAGNDNHGQKQNVVRPMMIKHVSIRPVVFKHVFVRPAVQPMYKPIVIKHVVVKPIVQPIYRPVVVQHAHKPMYRTAAYAIAPTYAGYKSSYDAPKYRYFPYATYNYDSAPKNCSLMLYKSDYGMERKVWRCVEVKTVEVAPVKIVERLVEKQVIEQQVIEKRSIEEDAPTDDTQPPK